MGVFLRPLDLLRENRLAMIAWSYRFSVKKQPSTSEGRRKEQLVMMGKY